ncbi:hypothetical protein M5K25_024775 [Dendrobium thyrsiflorum]|uniref:Ataxin 2 SM domain-containing protein n=1 Tax=Dendrobium thyrsiflorum TaxID=117978 RepID=A0ABD0U2R9_DENTH
MSLQQGIQSRTSANGFNRRRFDREGGARIENKTHPGKSGSSNFAMNGGKSVPASSPSSDRLIYVSSCLIGLHVEVHVKNGSAFSGIFYSVNAKDFGIILKMAQLIKDGAVKGQKGAPEAQKRPQTIIIPARELVQIIAKDVPLANDEFSTANVREKRKDLMIDSVISRSHNVELERELERWTPDVNDPECPELDNIFDGTWNRLMDLQNTAFTVQLGGGAIIQLANVLINTGDAGATIQFGSVDFPAIAVRTAAIPTKGKNVERSARELNTTEVLTRRVHLTAPRPTDENLRGRISVFERLSQPKAPSTKRIMTGGRISVVTADTTTSPTGLSTPRKNTAEASSSGRRLTRRQRRKLNAEIRAQQQRLPIHPSNLPALKLEANVATRNKFTDLKWVKRNSSTRELKKSFWDQQPEVPAPLKKKEPETLSARVQSSEDC